MRRICVSLCLVVFLLSASPAGAIVYWGDFDWRAHNGGNYVTPIRDQASLASCWAFGATAAVESRFLIYNNTPGVNLDLSEQHLVCDTSVGMGGHENLALDYVVNLGITNEATLPYISQSTSPKWPLARPYTAYKVTSVTNYCTGSTTTTSEIKSWLQSAGPLACSMFTEDWFDPSSLGGEAAAPGGKAAAPALDFSVPEWFQGEKQSGTIGPDDPVGGTTHCVCIVGYKDVPTNILPAGGYWIIKNSWNANWGDSGYGFLKYGDVEKHNRVHAVTGTPYTVVKPSRAPVAVNDTYSVNEDEPLVRYTYEGLRANDTDVNTPLEAVTVQKLTDPTHGDIQLFSNGSFVYTPDPNYHGADSFTYKAYDGGLYSSSATVTINVASVNDVPIAADDFYTCPAGGTRVVYKWEGVLVNDYDADNYDSDTTHNDTLSVVMQSGPSYGAVTWYSGGAFMYTPNPGFTGTDSLTYKVSDGTALSNLATVTLQVAAGEAAAMGVPEPSTVVLLLAAVLGAVALGRPRRSR
jgi:VCBS repeat-containing protein